MAQISKGDTFVDGQQVTGARLNQLVDASTLLVGAITDQPNITPNTLVATDSTIVNDGGVLKEATIGDILNSNLPITTSSITGGAGVDITVTPAATKKFAVNGAFETNSSNVIGNSTIGGNETISGNLAVTGTTTLTGTATANGSFISNGIANFAGTLQYKSTPIYGLFSIGTFNLANTVGLVDVINNVRISIVANWAVAGGNVTGAGGGVHWNESHTIPTGEMWEITWHWSAMRGGDDYFAVGVIRRQGGGSWTQIFDSQPQPSTYTNTPMTTVEVLTNTSGSPVTYDYSFKSAFGGGTGTDQAIVLNGGGGNVRVIRKYKIA